MRATRRLSAKDREELLIEFCRSLASIKNPEEAAQLIQDLLTENEVEVIAKRLAIARLLLKGMTFDAIASQIKASKATIARISLWLSESGEGFRMVVERTKRKGPERVAKENWSSIKRRYPSYFWPEILLESVVAAANRRDRERMSAVLSKVKVKSDLYRKLRKLLVEAPEAFADPAPKV